MNTSLITCLTCLSCLAGYTIGQLLLQFLPSTHYQHSDARDVLKTATGTIGTLVALVLGLLVSSAKSTYDKSVETMNESGAKIIQIDRLLTRYGPEAKQAQQTIREYLKAAVERIAHGALALDVTDKKMSKERHLRMEDSLNQPIMSLEPSTPQQVEIRDQARGLMASLADARWLMIERASNPLPSAFLVLLFFWLLVLFAGFGLLSPRNPTIYGSFIICSLSMAGAVFLILEMSQPLSGALRVSTAPLQKALELMDK